MALDFPDSPSNGQYYEGFVYDSTTQTWRVSKDPAVVTLQALVIGGGGGGGTGEDVSGIRPGGGGGAGGFVSTVISQAAPDGDPTISGTATVGNQLSFSLGSTFLVSIGAGGAGGGVNSRGFQGSDSVFGYLRALGGGWGNADNGAGSSGASGGGAGAKAGTSYAGGAGYAYQGHNGGSNSPDDGGGGGGGAGQVGANGPATNYGGAGGDGIASTITGSSVTYAGGGGGGGDIGGGAGGAGGGGTANGGSGTANTGGGGAGGRAPGTAGSGGSGVVIVRFLGNPTVTVGAGLTYSSATDGDDTVYTFTAGTDTITVS